MSLVYVYGSGECEQLGMISFFILRGIFLQPLKLIHFFITIYIIIGLGDEAPFEIKKARKIGLFD
jgi:hypothetical protein